MNFNKFSSIAVISMFMFGCANNGVDTTPVKKSQESVSHVIIIQSQTREDDKNIEQNAKSKEASSFNIYFQQGEDSASILANKISSKASSGAEWVWDKSASAWKKVSSEDYKKKMKNAAENAKNFVEEKIEQLKSKID
jgi:hypothetical protein